MPDRASRRVDHQLPRGLGDVVDLDRMSRLHTVAQQPVTVAEFHSTAFAVRIRIESLRFPFTAGNVSVDMPGEEADSRTPLPEGDPHVLRQVAGGRGRGRAGDARRR